MVGSPSSVENLFDHLTIDSPSVHMPTVPRTPHTSGKASPVACAICLSPVSRRSASLTPYSAERANARAPQQQRSRFVTPCCRQLFHHEVRARPLPVSPWPTCTHAARLLVPVHGRIQEGRMRWRCPGAHGLPPLPFDPSNWAHAVQATDRCGTAMSF